MGRCWRSVAAVDPETAEEAVRRIRVVYDPLPAVTHVLEAIKPDAPILHEQLATYPGVNPAHIRGNICAQSMVAWGDVTRGFARPITCSSIPLRPPPCTRAISSRWPAWRSSRPGGKLTLWTSTQGTYVVRSRLASLLGIPLHKVRVIVPHVGGGFGGKLQTVLEPYCALLAQRTGQPVKIVLSREEEFFLGKPRSAGVIHLKTGVTRDGMLVARQAQMYFDTGFACHPRSTEIAPTIIRGPYNIPHVRFEAYCVYTNKMGCGSFRGPGGIQAHFAGESQIDIICRELGLDPVEFRRRNGVREGGTSGAGVRLRHVGMRQALDRAAEAAGWGKPLPRQPGKRVGRGLACGEWRLGGGRGSGAWVKLNEDGTVHLIAGMSEIGSGSSTAMVQIAAEVLGVGADAVALISGDTETTPFDTLTAASRVTVSVGNAVKRAATDARDQLLQLAAERLEANVADLECRDSSYLRQRFARARLWARGAGPLCPNPRPWADSRAWRLCIPSAPVAPHLWHADRRGGGRRGDRAGRADPHRRRPRRGLCHQSAGGRGPDPGRRHAGHRPHADGRGEIFCRMAIHRTPDSSTTRSRPSSTCR